MAVLPNLAAIAVKRKMYVYGFYRLCKVHNVSSGALDDLAQLGPVLRQNEGFRTGVFRLGESVLSNEPGVSVKDVAGMLALAVGGPGTATLDEVQVPDELMAMFLPVPRGDQAEDGGVAEGQVGAAGVVEGRAGDEQDAGMKEVLEPEPGLLRAREQVAPVGMEQRPPEGEYFVVAAPPAEVLAPATDRVEVPAVLPQVAAAATPIEISSRPAPGEVRGEEPAMEPVERPPVGARRRPILGQALLADEPEEFVEAPMMQPVPSGTPALEVVAKVQRLETERTVMERRMQEMEERLSQVLQEVEALSGPARVPGQPGPQLVEAPQGIAAPVEERRGPAPSGSVPVPVAEPERKRDRGRAPLLVPQRVREDGAEAVGRGEFAEQVIRGPEAYYRSPVLADAEDGSRRTPWVVALCVLLLVVAAGVLGRRFLPRNAVTTPVVVPNVPAGTGAARPSAATPAMGINDGAKAQDWERATKSGAARSAAGNADRDISGTLSAWAAASERNDPVAESSFYAPRVDRYFLQRNVSRDYVVREKRTFQERGNRVQRFTISGVGVQRLSPTTALVSLTKTWSATGPKQSGGVHTTKSRIWMTRMEDGWKITGEQDLQAGG